MTSGPVQISEAPVSRLVQSTGNLYWSCNGAIEDDAASYIFRASKSNQPGQEIPIYTEAETGSGGGEFGALTWAKVGRLLRVLRRQLPVRRADQAHSARRRRGRCAGRRSRCDRQRRPGHRRRAPVLGGRRGHQEHAAGRRGDNDARGGNWLQPAGGLRRQRLLHRRRDGPRSACQWRDREHRRDRQRSHHGAVGHPSPGGGRADQPAADAGTGGGRAAGLPGRRDLLGAGRRVGAQHRQRKDR
jgi:hypothetical protein